MVAGGSDSRLLLLRVLEESAPDLDEEHHPSGSRIGTSPNPHSIVRVSSGTLLGKCSRAPVTCIEHSTSLLAAAGSSLSVWDVVSRQRTRIWSVSASDSANTCGHLTQTTAVCAGNGCKLHVFDTRSPTPAMSLKIASDNLYGLTVHNDLSVSVGGADGCVYRIDLRNQGKETAKLAEKCSVLDLQLCDLGTLVTLELGKVCLVPHFGKSYEFSKKVSSGFGHRISSDIVGNSSHGIYNIVLGSENGVVSLWEYEGGKCTDLKRVEVGEGVISAVKWGPQGIYVCYGAEVVVLGW